MSLRKYLRFFIGAVAGFLFSIIAPMVTDRMFGQIEIANDRIIFRKGLVREKYRIMRIQDINAVKVKEGLSHKIMGKTKIRIISTHPDKSNIVATVDKRTAEWVKHRVESVWEDELNEE